MTFRLTRPTSWGWQFHCFAWHLVSLTCGLSDYTYRKSERTSNLLLLYFLLFILFLFCCFFLFSLTCQVRMVKSSDHRPMCSPHPLLLFWLKLLFSTPDHSFYLCGCTSNSILNIFTCVITKPNFICFLLSQLIIEVFWPKPWRNSFTIILSNLTSNPLTNHVGVCFQICPDYDYIS